MPDVFIGLVVFGCLPYLNVLSNSPPLFGILVAQMFDCNMFLQDASVGICYVAQLASGKIVG